MAQILPIGSDDGEDIMPQNNSFPGSGALGIGLLVLVAASGCDGGGDDPPPQTRNPPPTTDLVWDQGEWDELNWQ
jgi:hypothetical protein